MIKEKTKVSLVCTACGNGNHSWHDVFYSDSAQLKKAKKTYITFCDKLSEYVIVNVKV
jgi:hypothetical protein